MAKARGWVVDAWGGGRGREWVAKLKIKKEEGGWGYARVGEKKKKKKGGGGGGGMQ